jgi:hypothetical protein
LHDNKIVDPAQVLDHVSAPSNRSMNKSLTEISAVSNFRQKSREDLSSTGSAQSNEKEVAYNSQFLPNHLQMLPRASKSKGNAEKRDKKGFFGKIFSNQVQADFDDFQLLSLQNEGSQGLRSKSSTLSECYGIDRGNGIEEFSSDSRAQITRSGSGSVQSSLSSESSSNNFTLMSNIRMLTNQFQASLTLKDSDIEFSQYPNHHSRETSRSHRNNSMNLEASTLNHPLQPDFGLNYNDVKNRKSSFQSNRSSISNASSHTTDSKLKHSSNNIGADLQVDYVDDNSRRSGSDSIQSRSSNEQTPGNSSRKRKSKLRILSNHVQADFELEKDEAQSPESVANNLPLMKEKKSELTKKSNKNRIEEAPKV